MRTVDELADEYYETNQLNTESLNDLVWHLNNDKDPQKAIFLVTDLQLLQLAPNIEIHLHSTDPFIREITIGSLLGEFELPEYAEIGFKMAQEDEDESVRSAAIFNIGYVLNKVNNCDFKRQIAKYLYTLALDTKSEEEGGSQREAYFSILVALEISSLDYPSISSFNFKKDINLSLVQSFKRKFGF